MMKGRCSHCVKLLYILVFSSLYSVIHTACCDGDIINYCDYIIVGCGSAGCTLASRLSENPQIEVCVFEAGPSDDDEELAPLIQTPYLSKELRTTKASWKYTAITQPHAAIKEVTYHSGKVLGGSSSINAMVYTRGSAIDYDFWEASGADGWGSKDVLPYFEKFENLQTTQDEVIGHEVNLRISYSKLNSAEQKFQELLIKGGQQINETFSDNCNQALPLGLCIAQKTIASGQRVSTSRAFLKPVMGRRNLHVYTNAFVEKVVIDKMAHVVTGINVRYRNETQYVLARREVILSAGAINTVKILMLSGIGPSDILNSFNIEGVVDLPVGQEFRTHLGLPIQLQFDNKINASSESFEEELLTYVKERKGLLADPYAKFLWFMDTYPQTDFDWPDIEIMISNMRVQDKSIFIPLMIMPLHPESIGSIRISSNDPYTDPIIDTNMLSHPFDAEIFLQGIRKLQQLIASPAFAEVNAKLNMKEANCSTFVYDSDEYWKCVIFNKAFPVYHSVSTCKMSNSLYPGAVVDPELRVIGMKNLRVADTSVIPESPTGHTNAVAIMIGERAADFIKKTFQENC